MTAKQKTISKNLSVKGVGLHTGAQVEIILKPGLEDSGIIFTRIDLPNRPVIKADLSHVSEDSGVPRCTTIGKKPATIHTVEHFLSALFGLGITNIQVDINGPELPGLDGSAIEFMKLIKDAGVSVQNKESNPVKITEAMGVHANGSSIYVFPSEKLKISYLLDYPSPFLKAQFFNREIDLLIYESDIAPCRTFCLEEEAKDLIGQGLGRGANYKNTLVIGKNGVINNQLRFDDEFARHKVLDFLGDLYLLGKPIIGHVFAVKSGHYLNLQLLKKICQKNNNETVSKKPAAITINEEGKKVFDINAIMKILPHRYPFLLVDRVIEMEHGKKVIGIKNVTINDNFFQGHFPTRPVMPGVLMVEAMAQTAGVAVLTNEAHRGKLAFFMAADNVKFRKVVSPGDQLIMEAEVVKDKSRTTQVHAVAKVDNEIVAEADMIFSFTDSTYLEE